MGLLLSRPAAQRDIGQESLAEITLRKPVRTEAQTRGLGPSELQTT